MPELDPSNRDRLREELSRFAPTVTEANGRLVADFGGRAEFAVDGEGRIEAGMPLHAFDGVAERLVVDHDAGHIEVHTSDGVAYTFRRP